MPTDNHLPDVEKEINDLLQQIAGLAIIIEGIKRKRQWQDLTLFEDMIETRKRKLREILNV